ncbi:MAG: hypothetical protein R2818_13205 [Flavobacteriales bacterium]
MIRPYALLLPFLFALTVSAQGPAQVFEFTSSEELPMSAEKYLTPEIHELDQQAQISIDGRTVKVRVAADVDPGALAPIMARAGLVRSANDAIRHKDPEVERDSRAEFPQRVDTGNTAADDAAFEAAKQEWRASHPQEYEAYRRSLRSQSPTPHE